MNEVDYAVAEFLQLSSAQRRAATRQLIAWIRTRSLRPDDDPQMLDLLRGAERLVATVTLRLDEVSGMQVDAKEGRVSAILARGTPWFRGGDWQSVILTAVSRETSITT